MTPNIGYRLTLFTMCSTRCLCGYPARCDVRQHAATASVDVDGAILGPDCVLIRRTEHGYRTVAREEAAALQDFLLGDGWEPHWLFAQCRRIAKALDNREIAFAQILGLHIPIGDLDGERLGRLAFAAPFLKANFNPNVPQM
ncbi:MAG: hypothetical protein JO038_09955 [Alphaproteobacteria bacterium]|nr:hypothetical protein [Alphaproteobacteria bacterium]